MSYLADRRGNADRRRRTTAIAHADRRIETRRQTELQAYVWTHQISTQMMRR